MRKSDSIELFYTKIDDRDSEKIWSQLIESLPSKLQTDVFDYLHWSDRKRTAAGKLLLRKALLSRGYSTALLSHIDTIKNKKPHIENCFHFNISHSGNLIGCAIYDEMELGLDIETNRNIPLEYFQNYFSKPEWDFINTSTSRTKGFLTCWTQKESIMKADGRGMSIPLLEIKLQPHILSADCQGQKWHLYPLDLDRGSTAHLALKKRNKKLVFNELSLKDLFL